VTEDQRLEHAIRTHQLVAHECEACAGKGCRRCNGHGSLYELDTKLDTLVDLVALDVNRAAENT
jgi:hypothetical protein